MRICRKVKGQSRIRDSNQHTPQLTHTRTTCQTNLSQEERITSETLHCQEAQVSSASTIHFRCQPTWFQEETRQVESPDRGILCPNGLQQRPNLWLFFAGLLKNTDTLSLIDAVGLDGEESKKAQLSVSGDGLLGAEREAAHLVHRHVGKLGSEYVSNLVDIQSTGFLTLLKGAQESLCEPVLVSNSFDRVCQATYSVEQQNVFNV